MKHQNPYKEALRYIEITSQKLKLDGQEGKYFVDEKYVKSFCRIAYSSVLLALDFIFDIKKVQKKKR